MTKRTILAFVLSGLFFVLYSIGLNLYYAKYAPAPKAADTVQAQRGTGEAEEGGGEAETGEQASEQPESGAGEEPVGVQAGQPDAGAEAVDDRYKRENVDDTPITLANDVVMVVFTPRNGSIKSVALNRYDNFERDGKLVLLSDFEEELYPTELTALAGIDLEQVGYALEKSATRGEDGTQRISFATEVSGLKIAKAYTIYDGKYGVGLDITIENTRATGREVSYELVGPAGIPTETDRNRGIDVQYVTASTLASGQASPKSFKAFPAWQLLGADQSTGAAEKVTFAGTVNQYFASVIRPLENAPVESATCFAVADSQVRRQHPQMPTLEEVRAIPSVVPEGTGVIGRLFSWLGRKAEGRRDLRGEGLAKLQAVYFRAGAKVVTSKFELGGAGLPEASATHSYLVYCGPKDKTALAAFNTPSLQTGFPALLDYGKYLDWFVRVLLAILGILHKAIPNWGVAIILLTLSVRGAMHPLTRRTQVSMSKMQRLQPEIKKLQEKYKNDKQKLGQEQMKLMKEKGANPMGGCLPMLVQLPVFFALYRAINVSLALRHAPFFLWITDLARPDRLYVFDTLSLPIIQNEINLLPLLMATAMVIQSKFSPSAATPEAAQQQKIMGIFMPLFIGVLLYRVASGLNLYILTSTVLGVLEQWAIRRHIEAKE